MSTYKSPNNLDESVIIIFPVLTGISNVDFYVSEDGTEAVFSYNWPSPLYNLSVMFKDNAEDAMKLVALQAELAKHRATMNDIPNNKLTIKLPFPVQTNSAEHIVTGYEEKDGSRVMSVELPGMKKMYSRLHKSVKFGKPTN